MSVKRRILEFWYKGTFSQYYQVLHHDLIQERRTIESVIEGQLSNLQAVLTSFPPLCSCAPAEDPSTFPSTAGRRRLPSSSASLCGQLDAWRPRSTSPNQSATNRWANAQSVDRWICLFACLFKCLPVRPSTVQPSTSKDFTSNPLSMEIQIVRFSPLSW